MADKVILVRNLTGENFIGFEKVQDNADVIVLKDPRQLVPQMTKNGIGVAATNVVQFAIKPPEEITIPKSFVLCVLQEDNIIDSICTGYKSEVSGIDLSAAKPEIIT